MKKYAELVWRYELFAAGKDPRKKEELKKLSSQLKLAGIDPDRADRTLRALMIDNSHKVEKFIKLSEKNDRGSITKKDEESLSKMASSLRNIGIEPNHKKLKTILYDMSRMKSNAQNRGTRRRIRPPHRSYEPLATIDVSANDSVTYATDDFNNDPEAELAILRAAYPDYDIDALQAEAKKRKTDTE